MDSPHESSNVEGFYMPSRLVAIFLFSNNLSAFHGKFNNTDDDSDLAVINTQCVIFQTIYSTLMPVAPFTNMVYTYQHVYVITCIVKCRMKLLIHS